MSREGSGFVYLVKLSLFDCLYKIGSTLNIEQRLSSLSNRFGSVSLVAYGYSNNRLKTEREIQYMLYRCCNRSVVAELEQTYPVLEKLVGTKLVGGITSIEHFCFDDCELGCAKSLFKLKCSDVKYLNDWGVVV